MALKQGRMRETVKKKSSASLNHWMMPSPGRRNRGSPFKNPPKSLPRRIAM